MRSANALRRDPSPPARPGGPVRLLAPAELGRFLRRAAAGSPPRQLASDFGLTYRQAINLRRTHRAAIEAICAVEGRALPFGCHREGQPRRPDWVRPQPDVSRQAERQCLSCGDLFVSAGLGERTCAKCRRRVAWREGGGVMHPPRHGCSRNAGAPRLYPTGARCGENIGGVPGRSAARHAPILSGSELLSAAGRPPGPGHAGQAKTLTAGGRCAADAAFPSILGSRT